MTRARFLTLADIYLGVGDLFAHEDGAITTMYHQMSALLWLHVSLPLDGSVNAPPCMRVSSRGTWLEHDTLDSLSLRAQEVCLTPRERGEHDD